MASSTGIDIPEKANGVTTKDAPESKETSALNDSSTSPVAQISTGGIGSLKSLSSLPSDSFIPGSDRYNFEKQYAPSGPKSLAGIALRSNLLGGVAASSILLSIYLLVSNPSPLWRIPFFLACLSIFHFLEFYTTALTNTPSAQTSSFLLTSNGMGYNLAHASAFTECLVTYFFFPDRHWVPNFLSYTLILIGLGLVVVGQGVRSVAMIQAGRSFNHIVQKRKMEEHTLVTYGIYAYLRHPSYFGFYWWGLGTQMVLGNPLAFIGYAVVLHRFFAARILSMSISPPTLPYPVFIMI